jgi:Ni/Co efflux regulator RcnB
MKKLVIGVFAATLFGAPAAFAQMGGPDHHDTMGGMMGHSPVHHGWKHGDHLPQNYWHAQEIDWNHYHLRRPPHGYHWVRVDDDFVLVAVATGIILDTVFAQ